MLCSSNGVRCWRRLCANRNVISNVHVLIRACTCILVRTMYGHVDAHTPVTSMYTHRVTYVRHVTVIETRQNTLCPTEQAKSCHGSSSQKLPVRSWQDVATLMIWEQLSLFHRINDRAHDILQVYLSLERAPWWGCLAQSLVPCAASCMNPRHNDPIVTHTHRNCIFNQEIA